jgi:hypothetical protein
LTQKPVKSLLHRRHVPGSFHCSFLGRLFKGEFKQQIEVAMHASAWFWIIYVVSIIAACFFGWPFERRSGVWVVLMVLIGIVGYGVFGSPIK